MFIINSCLRVLSGPEKKLNCAIWIDLMRRCFFFLEKIYLRRSYSDANR